MVHKKDLHQKFVQDLHSKKDQWNRYREILTDGTKFDISQLKQSLNDRKSKSKDISAKGGNEGYSTPIEKSDTVSQ